MEKAKASVEVTKSLKQINGNLMAIDQTFYVALYSDEVCEQRVSDVKEIIFKNNSVLSVKFTDLEVNQKYYVAECNAEGKAQTRGELADGTMYQARFNDGNSVTVAEQNGTQTVYFDNVFMKRLDGFYVEGNLTITKKLVGADGNAKKGNETFCAGIFAEENQEIHAESLETVSDEESSEIADEDVDIIFSDGAEEAKKASVDSLGTAEDAEYTFYDVTFTVDGNEAELPKGAAEIRMEFKNIPILEKTMQQMHGLFL